MSDEDEDKKIDYQLGYWQACHDIQMMFLFMFDRVNLSQAQERVHYIRDTIDQLNEVVAESKNG